MCCDRQVPMLRARVNLGITGQMQATPASKELKWSASLEVHTMQWAFPRDEVCGWRSYTESSTVIVLVNAQQCFSVSPVGVKVALGMIVWILLWLCQIVRVFSVWWREEYQSECRFSFTLVGRVIFFFYMEIWPSATRQTNRMTIRKGQRHIELHTKGEGVCPCGLWLSSMPLPMFTYVTLYGIITFITFILLLSCPPLVYSYNKYSSNVLVILSCNINHMCVICLETSDMTLAQSSVMSPVHDPMWYYDVKSRTKLDSTPIFTCRHLWILPNLSLIVSIR